MNYIHQLLLNVDFWSALFGFVGTILIFFFGLPPKVDSEGRLNLILEQEDEEEKKIGRKYKRISYIDISLLSISFFLQLIRIIYAN
jgi:hypothetical protein